MVGGHAVNAYGVPRLTKDLDVFIRSNQSNSEKVLRAPARFGAPIHGLSPEDFRDHPDEAFQIGVEPNRIDLLQAISGVEFDAAWQRRATFEVEEGVTAPFLSLEDLLVNKKESGRLQDLADIENLTKMKDET